MKTLIGLILFTFVQVLSQEIYDNKIITFGRGEVTVLANRGIVTFSVKGTGSSIEKAGEDARQKLKEVVEELKKFSISDRSFETAAFRTSENYGDKAFLSAKKDFQGTIAVDLTIDSLEVLEPLLLSLYSLKLEYVSDVRFSIKNEWEIKLQAFEDAAVKARQKAVMLAKKIGADVGAIFSIQEIPSKESAEPSYMIVAERPLVRSGSQQKVYYVPKITTEATVKLVFDLKK